MAASFPDACLQAKLSSLNITGKSVIIFKTKGTAEMKKKMRNICMRNLRRVLR